MTSFNNLMTARCMGCILLSVFWLVSFQLYSQTFPEGFSQVQVASGISTPTAMVFAPDGRIFITQQNGQVRIVKNGVLLGTPFTTISTQFNGERGLIGITLDPNFATNHYVYLYYTLPDGSRNRIIRVTGNGDVVTPGSETPVLNLDPLSNANNHNGGAMHFKDGFLYVAVGDNANGANAQNLDTYHGKLLRINPDGSVPAGNPFTGSAQRSRVWAYGLRNPFTIDIRINSANDKLYVNDVGENSWEEINNAVAGGFNFGWPMHEGANTDDATVSPFYAYPHGSGDGKGCAITGGAVYELATPNYPEAYNHQYYFQDLCNGWINMLDVTAALPVVQPFATGLGGQALGITTGTDGNLYYLERNAGALYRIVYTPPVITVPTITEQPVSQRVEPGATATFHVSASGTAPLSYQWLHNNENIPGANSDTYIITNAQLANEGNYQVIVTNSAGSAVSNTVTLTVNGALHDPEFPSQTIGGLNYEYYEGVWSALPDFNALTPAESGVVSTPDLTPRNRNDDFAFRFTGYILAPQDGIYTFYLSSDDGSRLQIGTTTVVDNDGLHAAQETSGTIGLREGYYSITITFFDHLGTQILTPSWSGPNITKQVIPSQRYFRTGDPVDSWTLEAEDAFLWGPTVANNSPGYSGTGYADYQNASGDYIIWFGNVPYAGLYQMTFRYAQATAGVTMNLTVNGSPVNSSLNFPSTGSSANWSTVSVNADLNGGSNTIKLAVTGGGGPNLDNLVISNTSGSFAAQDVVADDSHEKRMMAYPNPSIEGKLHVDWMVQRNEPVEVELVNFSGRVVKSAKFSDLEAGANTFTLDTEGLTNGVYSVRVKHGKERKASTVLIGR